LGGGDRGWGWDFPRGRGGGPKNKPVCRAGRGGGPSGSPRGPVAPFPGLAVGDGSTTFLGQGKKNKPIRSTGQPRQYGRGGKKPTLAWAGGERKQKWGGGTDFSPANLTGKKHCSGKGAGAGSRSKGENAGSAWGEQKFNRHQVPLSKGDQTFRSRKWGGRRVHPGKNLRGCGSR